MSTMRVESELAYPSEVAQELRVNTETVKRWLRAGDLEGVRLPSGVWRVPWSEVRRMRVRCDHGDRPANLRGAV